MNYVISEKEHGCDDINKDDGNDGGNRGETDSANCKLRQLFFWQIVVADNIFANFVPVIFLQIALKDNFFWQMVIMDHSFANIR